MTDRRWWGTTVLALAALAACRGDRARPERPDSTLALHPPPPFELTLQVPDTLKWNQQDSIRVILVNHTAAALPDARMMLTVTAPALLQDSTAGGTGVSTATLVVPALQAGDTAFLARAVLMPPAPLAPDSTPRAYVVRVALSQPALVREDTIHIRTGSEIVAGGCGTAGETNAQRFGVGPVRLRMRIAALRAACPEARDSAWSSEGASERGLVVRLGGVPILAELSGDSVVRIRVADARLRTAAGVGVGSTLADLRARYGAGCAGAGEGAAFIWFQNAPGISFGLDTAATRGWAARGQHPEELADTVRVAEFLVHGLDTRCPAP